MDVMLSAFVFPGAGQWMQGRPLAALLYAVLTLGAFVWLVYTTIVPLYANVYRLVDTAGSAGVPELRSISFLQAVLAILLMFGAYVLNVVDASIVSARRARRIGPPPLPGGRGS